MTRALLVALALTCLASDADAQNNLAGRLDRAIKSAGVPIVGVSIGDPANKATWKVSPPSLQIAAQPTIDVFDVNNPAYETAELDAKVKFALDEERLYSAIVWGMLRRFYPTDSDAQTKTKYQAAYSSIVTAYKSQPWK